MPDMTESKRAPAILAFTNPFRLVFHDPSDRWTATVEDINNKTYDYVKLHRLSASLDIGLPMPFCMHIGFDGSLLLPKIEQFWPVEKAVLAFNQILGYILVGGIYFSPVDSTDIDQALLYTTGYFRPFGVASSFDAQIRMTLQGKIASPLHSILLYQPKYIFANDILRAYQEGKAICGKIPSLSADFLVHGVSTFVSHDWAASLSHLWISAEQVIEFLWIKNILDSDVLSVANIPGRRDFLKDHRTWTTSARLEMLFQKGVISIDTYRLLSVARKARNDLVHSGKLPERAGSWAALEAVFQLIASIASPDNTKYFSKLLNDYQSLDPIERHYTPPRSIPVEEVDALWMGPLPPIPGEAEWGDQPYEKVPGT